MRPKSLILLALALGCGLVASIGISQVMEKNRGESKEAETEAIYVASKDIRDGEKLTDQVLELEQWPKAKIPSGAFMKPEEWKDQKVRVAIYKGEPIIKAKIADKMAQADGNIPKGKCTVAVAVDALISGGGLIRPRSYVDVLVVMTKNPSVGINETGVKTILKNIEVFAVDNQYKRGDNSDESAIGKVVSLLVTTKQARAVTLAAEIGKIRLVLKPPDIADSEKGETGEDVELTLKSFGSNFDTPGAGASTPTIVGAPPAPAPEPLKPKQGGLLDILSGGIPSGGADHSAEAEAKDHGWKMLVLEGSQGREVVFAEPNSLPTSSRKLFDSAEPATPGPAGTKESTP